MANLNVAAADYLTDGAWQTAAPFLNLTEGPEPELLVPAELPPGYLGISEQGDKLYSRFEAKYGGWLGYEIVWANRSIVESLYSARETMPLWARRIVDEKLAEMAEAEKAKEPLKPGEYEGYARKPGTRTKLKDCRNGHPGSERVTRTNGRTFCGTCAVLERKRRREQKAQKSVSHGA